jgi:hypothetical protein
MFGYLDIQESIEFYSVFSGYPHLQDLNFDDGLLVSIKKNVLNKLGELHHFFEYDDDPNFQEQLQSVLIRLAIGDRKSYTVYKKENIPQMKGRMLFKALFEKGIIKKEFSREKPIRAHKGQLIKKSLRKYKVQDKIHFTDNFTRFWFYFIAPHLTHDINIDMQKIEDILEKHMEEFISLSFEELSNTLIIKREGEENIQSSGSFWKKNIEIDVLIEKNDGTIIAGESKWKNQRTCKNVLRALENKCTKVDFHVDQYILCSKSGFSKELLNLDAPNVTLLTLQDFEELYD